MAKLLTEDVLDVQCLIEGIGTIKKYKITGVFAQSEKKNKNGRVYPKNILVRECNRFNNIYISKRRALGELGHPESPTINLDKVSHLITDLHEDGNNFMGTAEIIDTPAGNIVKNLLDAGVQLGVSTRGVGSLKSGDGYQMVGEDYFLSTIDIVADPSAPDAFVTSLRENKEWVMEHGNWSEFDRDKAKKMLQEASRQDYEQRALEVFANFLLKL